MQGKKDAKQRLYINDLTEALAILPNVSVPHDSIVLHPRSRAFLQRFMHFHSWKSPESSRKENPPTVDSLILEAHPAWAAVVGTS